MKTRMYSVIFLIFTITLLVLAFALPQVNNSNTNTMSNKVKVIPTQTGKNLVLICFNVAVDPGAKDMMASALSSLNASSTSAVVIEMNSQGGLLTSMISIVDLINSTETSGIPVYTYVMPQGFATAAATYIALASTQIWMSPGTAIGQALPTVDAGQLAILMDTYAISHGRNVSAVNNMICNNSLYSSSQAQKAGIINGSAANLSSFLTQTNLAGYHQNTISESLFDQFISFISNSTVDGLLISFGSLAILLDIYHRTIFMTLLGLGLMILGFLGAQLIDASVVGIAFLMMGTILVFLEFKTGHGIALISGIVIDVIGTLFLVSPNYDFTSQPYASGYSPSPINDGFIISAIIIILIGALIAFYINRIVRSQVKKPVTGWEALIGKDAEADTDLTPNGWVSIEGVRWKARTENNVFMEKGEAVTVIGINNLTLVVKKRDNTERPGI